MCQLVFSYFGRLAALLAVASAIIPAGCSGPFSTHAGKPRPSNSFPDILDILGWFPENTETVIVSRRPFQLIDKRAEQSRDFVRQLQVLSTGPLLVLREGFAGQLANQTVLLSVEASRGFRAPNRLGLMTYEGCHVMYFGEDFESVREVILTALEHKAHAFQIIGRHRVMMFEEKMESDQWTIYLTFLEANVLLCATDESFMRETLNRIDTGAKRQALPGSLPEWKYVDVEAQIWAVRHYDKSRGADDPSSPLSGHRGAYSVPDSEAIGMVMSFDPGRSEQINVKYLSSNKDALRIAKEYWEHPDYIKPQIRSHDSGVIEISAESRNEPFVLLLLGALGHGLYI